ncbi:MAG: hypothetical protein ACPGVN_07770, partial [Alphaproteobacteria bacterium]
EEAEDLDDLPEEEGPEDELALSSVSDEEGPEPEQEFADFEDFEEEERRRKMLRLWLKMPNSRELADEFPGRNGFPVPASVYS